MTFLFSVGEGGGQCITLFNCIVIKLTYSVYLHILCLKIMFKSKHTVQRLYIYTLREGIPYLKYLICISSSDESLNCRQILMCVHSSLCEEI